MFTLNDNMHYNIMENSTVKARVVTERTVLVLCYMGLHYHTTYTGTQDNLLEYYSSTSILLLLQTHLIVHIKHR